MRMTLEFALCVISALTLTSFADDEPNFVRSPDLTERRAWNIGKAEDALFTTAELGGAKVISVKSPGHYCGISQELKLQPHAAYRLSAEVKAAGPLGVRVRARQDDQKENEPGRPFDLRVKSSDEFVADSVRFTTGAVGRADLIIAISEESETGTFFVRNLKVVRDTGPEEPVKRFRLKPASRS